MWVLSLHATIIWELNPCSYSKISWSKSTCSWEGIRDLSMSGKSVELPRPLNSLAGLTSWGLNAAKRTLASTMAKPFTGKQDPRRADELMGQIVEEIFCDGVAESAGVWRKGPGEWTTAGLLNGTDESAGCSDLLEGRIVFLCDWVRQRFWFALASACPMHLPSSLLFGRSLHSYSLNTSQPSSVESAIKISLFLGGSFFSPSFSSSTAFSNFGGVDQRNEEVD